MCSDQSSGNSEPPRLVGIVCPAPPAEPVTTGPLVIDQSNVDKVLEVGKTHPGVRGAS